MSAIIIIIIIGTIGNFSLSLPLEFLCDYVIYYVMAEIKEINKKQILPFLKIDSLVISKNSSFPKYTINHNDVQFYNRIGTNGQIKLLHPRFLKISFSLLSSFFLSMTL